MATTRPTTLLLLVRCMRVVLVIAVGAHTQRNAATADLAWSERGTHAIDAGCGSTRGPCINLWPQGHTPRGPAFNGTLGPEVLTDKRLSCGQHRDEWCHGVDNVTHPTITPFIVRNGTGAAVLIAPGGGYGALEWSKEGTDVAAVYNKVGVSAFVLKYRVPSLRPPAPRASGLPPWFAPLQDAQRAVGIVRSRAATWGLNASRVGFHGSSAGGHLAAHLATSFATRIYDRVDAADDVSCRPDFVVLMYPWELLGTNPAFPSLVGAATADHPVAAFFHNADDHTAPANNTLLYANRLIELGAPPPTVHLYNTGSHGFGVCEYFTAWHEICDWPKAAQRFLQGHGLAPGWPAPGTPHLPEMLTQNCGSG